MAVQWFPGHMNAARRQSAEAMARVDVVIEVVDARLPAASSNPLIEELRAARSRPCLKLLSKSDLADPRITKLWLAHYQHQPGVTAVAVCAHRPAEVARIPGLCQRLAPHRNDGTKPLRMMIMGIPNVGKSTLLNALGKRRVAKVGDEPAITRQLQALELGGHRRLIDTPGLMWPKIEHEMDGYMLAASHAIGRNAVVDEEIALKLGEILLELYPQALALRYGLDRAAEPALLLEGIAERRACRLRGGAPDLERAAQILLNDYRSGALGRISLETPESRARMLAQAQCSDADEAITDSAAES